MSKQLSELCALIVENIYGKLPSRVFLALVVLGRGTLSALIRSSQLPSIYVRHGLAILVQHRLAGFYTDDNDVTFYEAETRNAYSLVRYGKYAQVVEDRFGTSSAELLVALQTSGVDSVGELLRRKCTAATQPSLNSSEAGMKRLNISPMVNGIKKQEQVITSDGNLPVAADFYSLESLLRARYLGQFREEDVLPNNDFHEEMVRREVEVTIAELKGSRMKEEFRMRVLKRKRAYRDDDNAASQFNFHLNQVRAIEMNGDHSAPQEIQESPKASRNKRAAKKRKLENGTATETVAVEEMEDPRLRLLPSNSSLFLEPVVHLNRDKLDLSLRSERFADMAARSLGEPTSRVYAALLRRLERQLPGCYDAYHESHDGDDDDYDHNYHPYTATTEEIERECIGSVDFGAKSNKNIIGEDSEARESRKKANGLSSKNPPHPLEETGSPARQNLVEQHLRLLEEHPLQFAHRVSHNTPSRWRVDFAAMAKLLIQLEIEDVVNARFGSVAVRIIRILHQKGKLDEKQLSSTGFIKQKDLRGMLTLMQGSGYVDTQEIPRDNSRQPSRTIYLWFYDQERVRKLLLDDLYKAMSRLLQRIQVEQEKVQTVKDKAERTDVKGHEEALLTATELQALKTWHEIEDQLLVQLHRQDDLVAILRDFLGPPLI